MPEEAKDDKTVPFHESIIEALTLFDYGNCALIALGRLIIATKIPQNHDKILEAYEVAVNNTADSEEIDLLKSLVSDVRNKLTAERDEIQAKSAAECDIDTTG